MKDISKMNIEELRAYRAALKGNSVNRNTPMLVRIELGVVKGVDRYFLERQRAYAQYETEKAGQ